MLGKLKKNRWSRFGDFQKSAKSRKFTKNYIGSDRMKKSNSRDHDNENQLTFTATKDKLNTHLGVISK